MGGRVGELLPTYKDGCKRLVILLRLGEIEREEEWVGGWLGRWGTCEDECRRLFFLLYRGGIGHEEVGIWKRRRTAAGGLG